MKAFLYLLGSFFIVIPVAGAEDFLGEIKTEVASDINQISTRTSGEIFLAGMLSTALAAQSDQNMKSQWNNHQKMDKATAAFGDHLSSYGVGPVIAIGQLIWDEDNGRAHTRALIETALATHFLKYTVGRERPDGSNQQSFPSGHTSNLFATATALTYAYGWKAAAIAYPLATLTGFSRLSDNKHWFSDVVAGATLGILFGRATALSQEQKHPEANNNVVKSSWGPVVLGNQVGINYSAVF